MTRPTLRAAATAAALLLYTMIAVWYALWVPRVVPASAPATMFSAERAVRHVGEIARRPHPVGSAEHARVRSYLLGELARIGVSAEVQETTGIGTRYPVAGRVRNVVARLPGEDSSQAVLLMAHYDAVPAAPGAGDDASGSAVLLETLRALSAGPRLRHDVIVLFADAEEAGLLGAAAFVREHPRARDVAVTINVEARGTHGPSLMFETGPGNLDVARELRDAPGARATSLSTAVYRRLPNDTDLSELMVLERPALNFGFIGGVDRYHTSQDAIEYLDPRSVQHHGQQVLALAQAFATEPLPRPRTGDAVFFDVPVFGLVVYPETWAVPLAVLGAALVIVALVLVRRHDREWLRGTVLGLLGTPVSGIAAALLAVGLVMGLGRAHTAIGSGRIDLSGLYVAATALLAFAVAASTYALVRRWGEPRGLQAGALAAWAILSLLVAIALPGGSFLFTWPLLSVAAAFVLVQLRPGVAFGMWVHGIAGVFTILLVTPIAFLMGSVALGLAQGAPIVALLVALTAWLLAFAFALLGDRSWRPAIVSAAAAIALAALGLATVRTDDEHPVGSAFAYVADADSGGAWLTGSAQTPAARRWVRSELVAMAGAGPEVPPPWLREFGAGSVVRAPALAPSEAGATVEIMTDATTDSSRVVTLRITPPPGTVAVTLRADSVQAARVDGRTVDTSRRRSQGGRWSLDYVAPDSGGFTLTLHLTPGAGTTLELASRRPGLPELEGLRAPRRPPGILPLQRGDVTLVHQRVPL